MNPYLLDLLLLPTSIQKIMELGSIRIKKNTHTFVTQKIAYRIILVIVVLFYICVYVLLLFLFIL